ncbi:MAG TPA: LysM domain-containing protein [Acidimicrobiales bacterium]|jgi:hypothetical protein
MVSGAPRPVAVAPGRPVLRLVERAAQPAPRVVARRRPTARVRRRRLLAAGVLGAAGLAALLPATTLLGRSPHPGSTSTVQAGGLPIAVHGGEGTYYVVRPGDTLESIAARLAPHDPAREASVLRAELGSAGVVAGEHVPLS